MEYKGEENTRQKARDLEQVDKDGNEIKNNHAFRSFFSFFIHTIITLL